MVEYIYQEDKPIIDQDKSVFIKILLTGFVSGVIVAVLKYILDNFILRTLVCDGGQFCEASAAYSSNIALLIVGIISVVVMVKMEVYRPLLVAIMAVVALWGFGRWMFGANVIISNIVLIITFTLIYVMAGWVARIRSVPVLVVIAILFLAIARFLPYSL